MVTLYMYCLQVNVLTPLLFINMALQTYLYVYLSIYIYILQEYKVLDHNIMCREEGDHGTLWQRSVVTMQFDQKSIGIDVKESMYTLW